jgi:hypothetical protein
MANQNVPRRRWIVRPRFQVQFAMVLVLLHVNVAFLYQVALHYRMRSLAEGAGSLEAYLGLDPWISTLPAVAVAALVSSAMIFFIGIRYSHQIVGPLPRITRALRELGQGKRPAPLTFRPGDALEELAIEVNALADSLHGERARPEGSAPENPAQVDPRSILAESTDREQVGS